MAHAFVLVFRCGSGAAVQGLWCRGYGVMGLRAAVRAAALRSSLSVLRRESCNKPETVTLSPLAQRAVSTRLSCELAARL